MKSLPCVNVIALPPTRADMKDDYERKVWDAVYGDRKTPLLGPGGISLYSPKLAESMNLFNEAMRYKNVVGRPLTETAILVAARELDQAYEWNSHENTARMIGVDPKVIGLPPTWAAAVGRDVIPASGTFCT